MTTPTVTTPDVKAIETLLGTYERSLNTADAELAASLYAPDGVFMPLFLPTAEGSEILGSYRQIFAAIKLEVTFKIDDLGSDKSGLPSTSQLFRSTRSRPPTKPSSDEQPEVASSSSRMVTDQRSLGSSV
jgi:hypothetical protein